MSQQKAGKYACYEYELRFFLSDFPRELNASNNFKNIEDIYFIGTNLRLRTVRSPNGKIIERKLTQKYIEKGDDLSKAVITNIYLDENSALLMEQLPGNLLTKMRNKFVHRGQSFAVDKFTGAHKGLILAEIEFEDEEQMRKFELPFSDWKNVTTESKYSGGALAMGGPSAR